MVVLCGAVEPPSGHASAALSSDQVLTLIIAGLSLLVAGVGTWLSFERAKASEATAREALEDARLARREAVELGLWTGAVEAVQRLMGFDPAREPMGTRMADLRVRLTLLADHFDDWDAFDEWLTDEHQFGVALFRQYMANAKPTDSTDERLKKLDLPLRWTLAFNSNLRRLRKIGYKPKTIVHLRDNARERTAEVYEANGWGKPPATSEGITGITGIEALDDLDAD